MDIREVDRTDEAELRAFWEVGRVSDNAGRPYDWWTPWEAASHFYRHGRHGSRYEMLAAREGALTVGTASASLPQLDNTHLGFVSVHVPPEHRRRGVGSALLARVEQVVREAGRRVAMAEAYAPVDAESPGLAFAHAHGYDDALEDRIRVVDLPATEPTWATLEAEAHRRRDGYRLTSWRDEVPDEHLAGYIRINEAFNDEAPSGEMELEAEAWDEERVRQEEANARRTGRHVLAVGALSATGELVGLTEIVINVHAPHRGFQSGTLVMPEHRGHALGLSMKVANQRQAREVFPECRVLLTGNAGVNLAMNSVNDRLGYRDVERCVEVHREL